MLFSFLFIPIVSDRDQSCYFFSHVDDGRVRDVVRRACVESFVGLFQVDLCHSVFHLITLVFILSMNSGGGGFLFSGGSLFLLLRRSISQSHVDRVVVLLQDL
uniref:Uncharacterized protein n=1 Tax=Cacopsylla melanoneura TaxID=428564 RepID=A0A8D9BLN1_9HEMI